jgi:capsular polysaccharide transport system permease protein
MASFAHAWKVQVRVIVALMIRELNTRFGRENIGFLWIVVEPLLFAGLVALVWRAMKGPDVHGVSIVVFVISGYIPLTLFRHSLGRCIKIFDVNSSLLYHRQIKIIDFIVVRFMIEMIGSMIAFVFIGLILWRFGVFPEPYSIGHMIAGWILYCMFTLSLCLVAATLSEMSDVLEKVVPVFTYLMIPLSGTFNMVAWLTPGLREVMLWSPPVSGMELMRYGLFGNAVRPYYDVSTVLVFSVVASAIGLLLCRKVRRTLIVG